ncbi:MAG: sodium:solute symporter, partial [Bacteroidota bacterium]
MNSFDWIVMVLTILFIVTYGLWKSKRNDTMESYLKASNRLPWYTISLSVIATQASAITFLSAPGQAYVDGMRFVQFYLGLPIAMVIISILV